MSREWMLLSWVSFCLVVACIVAVSCRVTELERRIDRQERCR